LAPKIGIHQAIDRGAGDRFGGKYLVEPPAQVPLKTLGQAVVPESELPNAWMVHSEKVRKSPGSRLRERLSFQRVKTDFPIHSSRRENVYFLGRHIEVPRPDNRVGGCEFALEKIPEPCEKIQFDLESRMFGTSALRHICIENPDSINFCSD
jgi:hypothetical protein